MISSDDQESESDQGSEDEEDASDDPSRDRRETFSKMSLKVSLVQLYRGFESRERYLSSLSLTPRHKVVRNL